MKTAQIEADRAFLVERFPLCFVAKGQPKRPLQVGIHAEMSKLGVLPDRRLKAFLGDYCRGPNYHEAVARGGPRYRLDGSIAGQVDETSRRQAVTVLGQIRKATADQAELKVLRQMRDALVGWLRVVNRPGGDDYLNNAGWDDLEAIANPASARGSSAPREETDERLNGGARAARPSAAPVVLHEREESFS